MAEQKKKKPSLSESVDDLVDQEQYEAALKGDRDALKSIILDARNNRMRAILMPSVERDSGQRGEPARPHMPPLKQAAPVPGYHKGGKVTRSKGYAGTRIRQAKG